MSSELPQCPVRIGNPETLLAVIPRLLGYRPARSLVVVAADSRRGEVRLALRYDLPDPAGQQLTADLVSHALGVLETQHLSCAVVVGYGPAASVTPFADEFRQRSAAAGLVLVEVVRVEGGRYWSGLCTKTACCPPDGKPLPATEQQPEAVLGSREELAATLAPVTGEPAAAARKATDQAQRRAARLIARGRRSGQAARARRLLAAEGIESVTAAIAAYRDGQTVTDPGQLACIGVALRDLQVRDDAWARMDPAHRQAHLRMWTDLTRNARPGYVAAPAALLAFVAWQCGEGALANIALDRAMADQPGYSMAHLLRQAISAGIPPSQALLPMTPEQVAASYAEADGETGTVDHPGAEPAGSAEQPATA